MANKRGSDAAASERRQKALDLRAAGARYRQIAKELGVSHQQAYRDVQEALDELAVLQRGKAEKVRDLELDRCDKLTLYLTPKARNGDEKAVNSLVRVMDRRSKLLGLDAPVKTAMTNVDGTDAKFTIQLTSPKDGDD